MDVAAPRSEPLRAGAVSLARALEGSPFQAYSYAYPHKTAYRSLSPSVALTHAWAKEPLQSLFLYVHVPFCEMRCGFCNLFTEHNPASDLPDRYVDTLLVQLERVASALEQASEKSGQAPPRFVRAALGGGTPTHLEPPAMERLLSALEDRLGLDFRATPTSLETSPKTATRERLGPAVARGIERVSIGVQSMSGRELAALGRPQNEAEVVRALDLLRELAFPVLNVDLIYGMAGQTPADFLRSVERVLEWRPEELYLYPLYVRPLTGLGRKAGNWDDVRLECHRAARRTLLDRGYEQVSLRMFRRPGTGAPSRPDYCCQDDGMVGLGCGARSYTQELHYSDEWAVARGSVRDIIAEWVARDASMFDHAHHGIRLDRDERARRFVIQSLLLADGLEHAAYRNRFGAELFRDFPELAQLREFGLAEVDDESIRLTESGLERSDTIGPWLYSPRTRALGAAYEIR